MEDIARSRIGELVARHPATSRTFRRFGIDFCCGGGKTVAEACATRGLDEPRVVEELRCSMEHRAGGADADDTPDWQQEDLGALVRFIVERFHVPLREELERLREMSRKVASVHGERSPEVWPPLDGVLNRFRKSLLDHMDCEEQMLFPLIERLRDRSLQSGARSEPALPVSPPIAAMEDDHDRAGADLRAMRELTGGFVPGADACNTVRALLDGLEHLEDEMHQHVHLENEVLFPRAVALERALSSRS